MTSEVIIFVRVYSYEENTQMADIAQLTVTVHSIGPVTEHGDGRPFLLLHGGAGPPSAEQLAGVMARYGTEPVRDG